MDVHLVARRRYRPRTRWSCGAAMSVLVAWLGTGTAQEETPPRESYGSFFHFDWMNAIRGHAVRHRARWDHRQSIDSGSEIPDTAVRDCVAPQFLGFEFPRQRPASLPSSIRSCWRLVSLAAARRVRVSPSRCTDAMVLHGVTLFRPVAGVSSRSRPNDAAKMAVQLALIVNTNLRRHLRRPHTALQQLHGPHHA